MTAVGSILQTSVVKQNRVHIVEFAKMQLHVDPAYFDTSSIMSSET